MNRLESNLSASLWLPLLGMLLIEPLASGAPAFPEVATIFQERCLDCHSASDPDGSFVMETYSGLMKGGENGVAVLPGKSSDSLLVQMIEGSLEKDGKKRIMPPGKRAKLTPAEIATVRAWIDAGAQAPTDARIAREISIPKIEPKVPPVHSIFSLAYEPTTRRIALGRISQVEVVSAEEQSSVTNFPATPGNVNAVVFSPDGKRLFAAGGIPGMAGEIRIWDTSNFGEVRRISGHSDSIYSLAISPDGKVLASGSYDQKIRLWNAETGKEIRVLSGHNGCIYGLAFRADGKILASASGDRTVKLWEVETGARRDTLSQPLKEQYTVAFSPDGKRLAAAGVDNRIRVWEVSEEARETTNPLIESKFAHEGSILRLAFSANGKMLASAGEDRIVKLWDAASVQEKRQLETQPEWAPAIGFILEDKGLAVGRMDGSSAYYDPASGSKLRPARPEIVEILPRGVERGTTARLKLVGKNLKRVSGVKSSDERIKAELERDTDQLWIRLTTPKNIARGSFELNLIADEEQSDKVKMWVDDVPQVLEPTALARMPVAVWGTHRVIGDKRVIEFNAKEGETLIFDAAAKSIGSKADLLLTLTDGEGKVIEASSRFDKTGDPFIAHEFAKAGTYRLAVSELVLAGSAEHFYRVTIGSFPYVTAVFPPLIHGTGELELIGFNLEDRKWPVSGITNQSGEPVRLDPEKFRWRGALKVAAGSATMESEPNDGFSNATSLMAPGVATGRIAANEKEDWFRFEGKKGQEWIVETAAEKLGSPLDTRIEIRDAQGNPIVRTLLQAVRGSAVTFRGIDSTTVDCRVENWEEMELNQYLYLQGEIVRLFRAPQGPDSGFNFYALNGKRRTYFDTTASAHANAEPCYIVEPHQPGAKMAANGLPSFPVFFENDDDAERKLGTDSKIHFIAPSDGTYFVRVKDTRGFSGDEFIYTLSVREPRPDFSARIEGMAASVPRGSGQRFAVNVERVDGFEGVVKVELDSVPPGLSISNPIMVEQGHTAAFGTIYAQEKMPVPELRFTASALVNGRTMTHSAGVFTNLTVADKAPLYVELEPLELTISPGGTVPATLKIRRDGHSDLVTFQVENLPHGIIVDNIGLNGVLIPKDQNEREIFITAARWVPETERYCYAISNEAGRQTSRPVLIKVRKNGGKVAVR